MGLARRQPGEAAALTVPEARHLTERIKQAAEVLWALLLEAHEVRAWQVLGYANWREYAGTEFGMSESHAYRLLDQGRVIRALTDATGVSPMGEIVTEREARDIKPRLAAVVDAVRTQTEGVTDPAEVRKVVEQVVTTERAKVAERKRDREELAAFVAEHTPEGFDPVADEARIQTRQTLFEALNELLSLPTPREVVALVMPYQEHHIANVRPAIEWLAGFEKEWANR